MGDFSQIKDPFTKNKGGPEKRRDALRGWNKSKQRQEFGVGKRESSIWFISSGNSLKNVNNSLLNSFNCVNTVMHHPSSPRHTHTQMFPFVLFVWKETHVTHCLKESNKFRLTLIAVHSSKRGVKAMSDSVWSELIHNLCVSVVFFHTAVIWRETHHSERVKGFFSLLSPHPSLCKRQQTVWLVLCQVGSFNSTLHGTYFWFCPKDSWLCGFSASSELSDKP